MIKFKAEITLGKNGRCYANETKTFKDRDTACCFIANRAQGYYCSGRPIDGMVEEVLFQKISIFDFGSEAYFGRITEVEE